MEYNLKKRKIVLNRELSNLDKFVFKFIKIIENHVDYVIISGYISIVLGRTRATEDVDIFIKKISYEKFCDMYQELKKKGFWCINGENEKEIFSYLNDGLAVRFAKKGSSVPNFEVKFPKRKVDEETFEDFILLRMPIGKIKISSLERQIAFKRYYLGTEKDVEDALHIEEAFKGKINHKKINKLKEIIDKIKEYESRKQER